jgi:hypothetical protein
VGDAGLRPGVKDGVATTDVCPDRVSFADPVANGDPVAVTGTAAGEMVFTLGKEGGENAVLHVKHGDVLVKR